MPDAYRVYAHNWPALEVWRDSWRAWRWVPRGLAGARREGLDWCQVEAVMRMRRVPPRERTQLLDDLRRMQDAALTVLEEER